MFYPVVRIKFEISKPYAEWERAFLDHGVTREEFGIEHAFHGQLESGEGVMVGLKAESQNILDALMAQVGLNLESTGHILESTVIEVVVL